MVFLFFLTSTIQSFETFEFLSTLRVEHHAHHDYSRVVGIDGLCRSYCAEVSMHGLEGDGKGRRGEVGGTWESMHV